MAPKRHPREASGALYICKLPINRPSGRYVNNNNDSDGDNDSDRDSDDEDNYLQKLDDLNKKNIIQEYHPELLHHNHSEIEAFTRIVRDEKGVIIDPLHKTLPFITKYERARILGERAKQLNMGAKPLIDIGPEIIDGYIIAEKEYVEKKIPFIVKRPMPNGGCEYCLTSVFSLLVTIQSLSLII